MCLRCIFHDNQLMFPGNFKNLIHIPRLSIQVYWYNSLAAPMTVVAEVPPTPIVTTGPGPVVLDSSDFSAKLYRDRTEIKKKDKDGNWVTSVRPTTPADQRMRNYVMASKKAR